MIKYVFGAALGGLLLLAAPASAAPPVPADLAVKPAAENVHYRRYRHRHYRSRHYGYRSYRYYPRYYGYRHYPRYYGYGYYGRPYWGPRGAVSVGPLRLFW